MSNSAASVQKQNEKSMRSLGRNTWGKALRRHYWLYLMLVPGVVWMLVFCYLPMGGLIMAFENFSPYAGSSIIGCLVNSPKVGFDNFKMLFTGTDFMNLLRNTLSISIANILIAFPAPIILALILNELKCMWFKRLSQTFVYIPHFISLVIVATLTFQLFSTTEGIVYNLFVQIFGKANAPDLAARIDGAGRWNLMWHVTLPAIRGTIVIMLIMKVGALLNTGYEQIFLMQNAMNRSVSEVFDTYVYTRGVQQGQYSLATTAGLFKSVVSLIMVLGANKAAKLLGESGMY